MLKPIDIVVLGWLICGVGPGEEWTQAQVADALGVSQSSVHRALRQLATSQLWLGGEPARGALHELLVHGARYVYPPELGAPARGLPTAHGGPGMASSIAAEQPYVWPSERGAAFGPALRPLHPAVPAVAMKNQTFYQLMSLIDVLRVGRARERTLAAKRLAELLEGR